jgi:hypothetical protein
MTKRQIEGIHRIDDFLPKREAEYFHTELFKDNQWDHSWTVAAIPIKKYNVENDQPWGWEKSLGNDIPYIGTDLNILEPHIKLLWDHIESYLKSKTDIRYNLDRVFGNTGYYGHSFGRIHQDPTHITALYYPCKDWNPLWEGGTFFYNDKLDDVTFYSSYKFNRITIFDSSIWHRPADVTRNCFAIRHAVVFQIFGDSQDMVFYEQI